jgi:hypothetical protein
MMETRRRSDTLAVTCALGEGQIFSDYSLPDWGAFFALEANRKPEPKKSRLISRKAVYRDLSIVARSPTSRTGRSPGAIRMWTSPRRQQTLLREAFNSRGRPCVWT